MQEQARRPPERRGKRLLWFVALYVMSLVIFAALVYGLKLIIPR